MLRTRTGRFPIGLRRSFPEWHKDLGALIEWMKKNDLGVLDLGSDADTTAKQVIGAGLRIGSVDLPGWQALLSKDKGKRRNAVARASAYIQACRKAAGGPLNFFTVMLPEDRGLPRTENFGYMVESFSALTPVLEEHDSAIVIEGWPGPGALCCTPETYRAFFEKCPSRAMGVNFDPSHLIRMGIDPLRFLREFGDRVYHVHGKDTELLSDELYDFGNTQAATFAGGIPFGGTYWRYTIPGHGVMRWGEGFKTLKTLGYEGCVSIELEDANFFSGDDVTKAGILYGAHYLEGC